MEDFKIIFVKYDDDKKLLESLKVIMKEYEMELKKVEGDRYIFDRDGGYTREFAIYKGINGWTVIHDEDDVQAESMCQELSELSQCFIICIGVYNEELLFYTAFNDGAQVDQYMSTMEYYEYEINDDAINTYRGNAESFGKVIGNDNIAGLQHILDECRGEEIEAEEAYTEIKKILGLIEVKDAEPDDKDDNDNAEQEEQEEQVIIDIGEMFYVDFNSINVKTDNLQKVIESVKVIAKESGVIEVESFDKAPEEKKGFFKKLLSSVTEDKRISFYISPVSDGWVTLVGEIEILYGGEPAQWDFLHIEDKLSSILEREVINIFGDSERWGFKVFKDGSLAYEYSSDNEYADVDDTLEIFHGIDIKPLNSLLESQVQSPEEIDSVMEEFCSMLKIRNYKVNIPMDYTEEEYKLRVLDKLPDGDQFITLRYIRKR